MKTVSVLKHVIDWTAPSYFQGMSTKTVGYSVLMCETDHSRNMKLTLHIEFLS